MYLNYYILAKIDLAPLVDIVSILSVSYLLKKNSGSDGSVTNLRNQARTCMGLVHIISQLKNHISRLMFSLVYLYFLYSLVLATESEVSDFVKLVD